MSHIKPSTRKPVKPDPFDLELAMMRRACRFDALSDGEKKERIHITAMHCIYHAQARRFVREVAFVEQFAGGCALHGYGRTYGEKLSEQEGNGVRTET